MIASIRVPENPKHYYGDPCQKCGGELYYLSNYGCVACQAVRSKEASKRRTAKLRAIKNKTYRPEDFPSKELGWKLQRIDRLEQLQQYGKPFSTRTIAEILQFPAGSDLRRYWYSRFVISQLQNSNLIEACGIDEPLYEGQRGSRATLYRVVPDWRSKMEGTEV